jgi:hypothetical protein
LNSFSVSFDVLQTGKIKSKKVFSSISPNSVVNCLEKYSFFNFVIMSDGKEMLIPQYIEMNLYFSQLQKKLDAFSSDIAFNCTVLGSYGEAWKKIRERVSYLDKIFDEEKNEKEIREKYHSTRKLLLEVLGCLNPKIHPLIGIDDNGQIGAEWQDGPDYKILSIIPRRENDISLSCIKKKGEMLCEKTTLQRFQVDGDRELSTRLGKIPW